MGRGSSTATKIPEAELVRLLSAGVSVGVIAEQFDCTQRTVRNTAKRHGVTLPARRRSSPAGAGPRRLRYPVLTDPGWLQEQFAAGGTLRSVAADVGCSPATVRRTADRLGVERLHARRWPQLRDGCWLESAYVQRGLSLRAVGCEVGCSGTAVSAALARHGISTRRTVRPELDDPVWLRRRYLDDDAAAGEIAAALDVHENTVYVALARLGIPRRARRRSDPRLDSAVWLHDRYVVAGRSAQSIAVELGRSLSTVRVALRRHSIRRAPIGVTTHRDDARASP